MIKNFDLIQEDYKNLNQVALPVSNMNKVVRFYQLLGFILIVDTSHYARFECPMGKSSFSLYLASEPMTYGALIYFEHPELDNWVNALIAKGVEFSKMPTDETYFWREAVLFDPSSNKFKLYGAGDNRLNPPWRV
ncbi:VOC family protein [uncultured Shewanella sp.]|uniref:VOC family protein n=1 Tax=uncultured Shewanella sp. TaxID=173975 RepID=UPI003703C954